jgi:hypothetical protein
VAYAALGLGPGLGLGIGFGLVRGRRFGWRFGLGLPVAYAALGLGRGFGRRFGFGLPVAYAARVLLGLVLREVAREVDQGGPRPRAWLEREGEGVRARGRPG